jgi:hypothetical protein
LGVFATANVADWYARTHTEWGPWGAHQVVKVASFSPRGEVGVYTPFLGIPLMTAGGNITTLYLTASFGLVSGDCAFSMYALT